LTEKIARSLFGIWASMSGVTPRRVLDRGGTMVGREEPRLRGCLPLCIMFLMECLSLSIPAMAADAKGTFPRNPLQAEQTHPRQMIRASRMVEQPVYNEQGQEIGKVDDLIMSRSGKIKKVILWVGASPQSEEKLVAVSFRLIKKGDEGHIVCTATEGQLKRAPGFSYVTEGLFGRPFYPFPPYGMGWGYQAPPLPFGEESVPFPRRRIYRGGPHPWAWGYYPERLRVSALLDEGLLNDKGDEVADLEDLMIDPKGRVELIILDVGGFSGMAEKRVAVPYRPLKITDLGIVYNITEEKLRESPAFRDEGDSFTPQPPS
jgi:sporulation protein YlmC with PRC-barrel domain